MLRARGFLGATLLLTRAFQSVSLIGIIGLTSSFLSTMYSNSQTPPSILLATLSISCIATLYAAISTVLYLDNLFPFLIGVAVDTGLLVCFLVLSIVMGKTLSFVDCFAVGGSGAGSGSTAPGSAYAFVASVSNAAAVQGFGIDGSDMGTTPVVFADWVASGRATCFEVKAVWGLCVAGTVFFAFSALAMVVLWRQGKKGDEKGKGDA